jgi:hypothetical protein
VKVFTSHFVCSKEKGGFMALFIAQTDGTTNFEVGLVQLDLIAISKIDQDLGFEETATVDIEGITCIPVTYTQNETGATPERLDELVNRTDFVEQTDVVIFGLDCTFMLNDGTSMCGNGTAVESPANNPVYNTSWNPFTATIPVFYDVTYCDGAGMIVDKDGGGHTAQYSDVVLYHELSHAYHFLNATQPPLNPTVTESLAQEEVNAEIDENDMRDVRGVPHRDVNSHWGACGGGETGCCIVASLATGSAFSDDVNRFRLLREHTLRQSVVGDDFFKEFFYRYYGFSPEVTRLMGRQPSLSDLVKDRFVLPLLAGVEMLIFYADQKGDGLCEFIKTQSVRSGLSEIYRKEFLAELSSYLKIARNFDNDLISKSLKDKGVQYSGFKKLLKHINKETIKDEYVNWALVSVVEVWVESALLLYTTKSDAEIGFEIYEKIIKWIALMPVSNVWEEFSRIETETELQHLEQFIFDPISKEIFSGRLVEKHSKYSETILKWVEGKRS